MDVARESADPADKPVADYDLVCRCQDGDLTAFEELVGRYQDRVFNLMLRLVGQHEDAQDLTQDVFLRALEHIGQFRQQAQIYTWLFRIGMNLAISRRRRQQRVRFVPLAGGPGSAEDPDDPPAGADPPDPKDERPDEAAQSEERNRRVAQAIAELDEEFRAVLVLKDIEGLDYQQIAEILEVPLGTVKSRLHRARSELKARFKPLMPM